MNLYLISQDENNEYDTYDSAVVCAPDEETARHMDPGGGTKPFDFDKGVIDNIRRFSVWAYKPEQVTVKLIGTAVWDIPQGVVCASFNAG